MSTQQHFVGGVLREQWTNATQAADPAPAGYTAWSAAGAVTATRALTAAESAMLAAQDASVASVSNQTTINARLLNHRTQLLNWIAANPNGAVLTAAQTLILAQMLIDLTDADLGLLSDTTGT